MEEKANTIYTAARKLFATKGFKDTNVSEIARDAGIGVGTFYTYYGSKEELFLKVFIDENTKLKTSMFKQIKAEDEPAAVCTRMMVQYVAAVNSNRILAEWYNRELFSKLEKYYYQQKGTRSIADFMQHDIAGLVKQWKNSGKIRKDIDDEMILALLYSVVYVDMHKTEIGIQHFPEIITWLYQFIIKGLADVKKR